MKSLLSTFLEHLHCNSLNFSAMKCHSVRVQHLAAGWIRGPENTPFGLKSSRWLCIGWQLTISASASRGANRFWDRSRSLSSQWSFWFAGMQCSWGSPVTVADFCRRSHFHSWDSNRLGHSILTGCSSFENLALSLVVSRSSSFELLVMDSANFELGFQY